VVQLENLFIKELSRQSVEDQALEIVERKGVGHPDTICDSIMNRVSVELSKEYLKRYGRVLHPSRGTAGFCTIMWIRVF